MSLKILLKITSEDWPKPRSRESHGNIFGTTNMLRSIRLFILALKQILTKYFLHFTVFQEFDIRVGRKTQNIHIVIVK